MHTTVDGFGYEIVTPLVAYLMACLGSALGLRCTTRSMLVARSGRPWWLALGSAAIGSGIWTMHFVAMTGFTVEDAPIGYDWALTFASLAVAIVMVGVGIFIVGYRGARGAALFTGGTVTGLGIASMHYLGMAGMTLEGQVDYNTFTVALSVVIAMACSVAALWAAGQVRGMRWSMGAGLVLGLGVTGTHYTGMAALQVHVHGGAGSAAGAPAELLGPMLIGPLALLVLAAAVVMFDPLMVTSRPAQPPAEPRPGVPAHPARTTRHQASRVQRHPHRPLAQRRPRVAHKR